MRKIYQFLLLLILTVPAIGQNKIDKINLTYGEELPDDGKKIVKIVGETANKIYALAIKGKDQFFIKTFDSASMKILSSNEIVIPTMSDKDVDFEEIFMLNGKLYVIGSVYNRKEKIFNLTATQVSEKGILDKNSTVLFDAEVAKKSKRGDFYFKLSPDDSTLLIMHTSEFPKEDAIKYDVKLFDENLKMLFSNVEKVNFDDSKKDYEFTISDFEVNFQNDAFLVINESYRDSKKKEQIEKFEIHTFKAQDNYAKEVVKIDIKDKEIINCSLLSTNKNTLKVVGFYSSVRDNGKANKELKGVYNGTINLATNQVESVKFNEFDYETKVKLIGERRAKKGKDVKPLYNITTIIEKNDGGLIVLSEYQLVVVGRSSGIGPLALTPITYTKNEIIVTSLKPDGSLDWSNVIPKEQQASVSVMSIGLGVSSSSGSFTVGGSIQIPIAQMGKGPEYLGAIPIYKNGVLNVLINDNVKNKGITDIEEIKSLGNYNKAVPALFVFDDNGNISRKDPEEVIKNELVLRPGVYYRKSAKEFIVYSSRKKKDKLGRMILED
ncbi:hypothetical protein NHF50_04895 [Flavobacterium sp. NRK F10]|uniref:Uncharacterized protein n=1 Tax=Flavobacterium sediminis TaxID=2201181 RepID=A0A2U8QTN6_9FLAO|nr:MULTISPECIES: hypothetical protein [Flavobacterium]AWM13204.1 hypothetical protein DI487_04540 [Flavobacterium sediminis]MCO6174375.1 hypothetical protein [Flavobacterium sp. NRK F10]